MQALDGLRAIDLSRGMAGHTAAQVLADLGAEVIRIERPGTGDDSRGWGPPSFTVEAGSGTAECAHFPSASRGTHSVAVDIANRRGRDIVTALAARADVLVEDFEPGDLASLGLDHATLHRVNPRLVYCSISGFGHAGPESGRTDRDFPVQGEGGVMSLTREADGPPIKAGGPVADVLCGMHAAVGILAAIEARHRSGRGQQIEIAPMDVHVAMPITEGVACLTDRKLPAGPVDDLAPVFGRPQAAAGGLRVRLPLRMAVGAHVEVTGTSLRLSSTPVTYAKTPQIPGADTGAVLSRHLGLQPGDLRALQAAGVIDGVLDT